MACNAQALGGCSHAEGLNTTAAGTASHAEGYLTLATGDAAHVEGGGSLATGLYSHAEGFSTSATNVGSHAEGYLTQASGPASHAEGGGSVASGLYAHAEGQGTSALAINAHAEGEFTIASGVNSHAEGFESLASGQGSHAEGEQNTASGRASHAEGSLNLASGLFAHAEGQRTVASGDLSHAQGNQTTASGLAAHAEGALTTATEIASHAEGVNTVANALLSHTEGQGTSANGLEGAHIMGRFGAANELEYSWYLANGTSDVTPGLAAKILSNGDVKIDGTVSSPAADYAEMFETLDGLPLEPGYFVALEQDKVRTATESDRFVIGVTSAKPAFLSDSAALRWHHKFMTDEWGRIQYETVKVPAIMDEACNSVVPERTLRQPVLNPDWDASLDYIPRSQRPEWVAVGMIGKLLVRDDGTSQPGGLCIPNHLGVATASDQGFLVLKRTLPHQILILVGRTYS
ncbi:hypothetical protein SY83_17015 [Paenibacillus swuensis]|uniref:Uncharacterized protein n=1 Tax=Paenibacillus swuensis TaxID=1178515 RepID=A0A172TKZ3_9BACL|nr:peptidase G2 autoproteolytic cleavage domain-containing protein [Paenibacillus swuensis]ANE47700.1 hypothetical protein SY83_17015 [Paenibacillus swuensis]